MKCYFCGQDISDKDSLFTLGDMDIQLYNYKNEYDSNGNLKRVFDDNSNSNVAVVTVAGKKSILVETWIMLRWKKISWVL